jgi:hypothetical protein
LTALAPNKPGEFTDTERSTLLPELSTSCEQQLRDRSAVDTSPCWLGSLRALTTTHHLDESNT